MSVGRVLNELSIMFGKYILCLYILKKKLLFLLFTVFVLSFATKSRQVSLHHSPGL